MTYLYKPLARKNFIRTTLRSKGGEISKDDVSAKNIRSLHVAFLPSSTLNKQLQEQAQYAMS